MDGNHPATFGQENISCKVWMVVRHFAGAIGSSGSCFFLIAFPGDPAFWYLQHSAAGAFRFVRGNYSEAAPFATFQGTQYLFDIHAAKVVRRHWWEKDR